MGAGTPGIGPGRSTQNLILTYIACYLLLLLFGAMTMWLLFSLRDNLIGISLAMQVNPWVLRAIDRFGIFLLGLCWLSAFILIESYFRSGVQKHIFWRRAGKTFLILALISLASQVLNWLL